MKPTVSGVPGRSSITIPTAMQPITVELQSRKSGSRQRVVAIRSPGIRNVAHPNTSQPRQTVISRPRCSLRGDCAR